MTPRSCNFDDFGMATATLAGPLEARLAAIRDAGFTQVMLEAGDLAQHPGGLEAAARAVKASGLRVTGLQWLRDFEGLSDQQHAYKLEVAQALLQMAHAVGAPMLMVCASTHPAAAQDLETIARDLRKLAMLAIPLGLQGGLRSRGREPDGARLVRRLGRGRPRRHAQPGPGHRHRRHRAGRRCRWTTWT